MRGLQNELSRSTGEKRQNLQAEYGTLLAQSQAAVAERRRRLPKPEFQPELPVNERRADIVNSTLIGDRPQFSSLLLATPGSPRMLSASTLPPLPQFRFAAVDGREKRKMTAGRADYNAAPWFSTPATSIPAPQTPVRTP